MSILNLWDDAELEKEIHAEQNKEVISDEVIEAPKKIVKKVRKMRATQKKCVFKYDSVFQKNVDILGDLDVSGENIIFSAPLGENFKAPKASGNFVVNRNAAFLGSMVVTGTTLFATTPSSSKTPTTSTDLTNKAYVDSAVSNINGSLLTGNNVWTGTNTFNAVLPTSNQTPSASNQLTTKTYVDSAVSGVTSSNNTWTGTNAFNTSLPTSTVTPTSQHS